MTTDDHVELVTAILDGHIPGGSPLPSGRKLAQQLGVSRNTVVLAYQHLVDEGYLVSRERSGYYVNQVMLSGHVVNPPAKTTAPTNQPEWDDRIAVRPSAQRNITKPKDWDKYSYPFIYGQFDHSLFPIAEWRECCRHALSVLAIRDWLRDSIDGDDPMLIEQLHTRVLPRRGVWASPDEILITIGAQQALFLLASLLVRKDTTLGIEDPGYADARNIFCSHSPNTIGLPIDNDGLIIGKDIGKCDYI